jgi:hypothetical protein
VLFDDFDGTDIATGDVGSINGGFQLVSNDSNGTGTIGEIGGLATIATASNSFDNSGIVSINSFDASAATSITATWVVDSQTSPGSTNGVEFALQGGTSNGTGDGSGFRSEPNIRFVINSSNQWTLAVKDGTTSGNLSANNSLGAAAGTADGYSFTLTLDAAGWALSSTDFATNIATSGTWTVSGFDFSDLQGSLYASSIIQSENNNNNVRTMNIDSITVDVIPEPSSAALIMGLGVMGLLARRRR